MRACPRVNKCAIHEAAMVFRMMRPRWQDDGKFEGMRDGACQASDEEDSAVDEDLHRDDLYGRFASGK